MWYICYKWIVNFFLSMIINFSDSPGHLYYTVISFTYILCMIPVKRIFLILSLKLLNYLSSSQQGGVFLFFSFFFFFRPPVKSFRVSSFMSYRQNWFSLKPSIHISGMINTWMWVQKPLRHLKIPLHPLVLVSRN